jgi:hypothetical protein
MNDVEMIWMCEKLEKRENSETYLKIPNPVYHISHFADTEI